MPEFCKLWNKQIKCRRFKNYLTVSPPRNICIIQSLIRPLCLVSVSLKDTLITEKREKRKLCPCLSRDVKKLLTEGHMLLEKYRMRNHNGWVLHKHLRSLFTNQVKQAKQNYHRNFLSKNSKKPRKFWSNIKSVFPTKATRLPVQNTNKEKKIVTIQERYFVPEVEANTAKKLHPV